jgi:MFS family permease
VTPDAVRGVWAFALIWLGQLVSLVGSGLTGFALSTWVYQDTDSVTAYTLVVLAIMAPSALLSPLAGALVDRWNRRTAMLLSDAGAAVCTFVIALLLSARRLELWSLLLAVAASSAFGALQWPAFSAATTLLVPRQHYGRANGLLQVSEAIGYVVPPALAGFLVIWTQVRGVVLLDFGTFLLALITLLLVRVPRHEPASGDPETHSLLREILFGWTYLGARPGLMGLLIVFALTNLALGLGMSLFTPMALSFADVHVVGVITSIGATGMLAGGLAMSVWGGPKRRVRGVLGSLALQGLAMLIGGIRPSIPIVCVATFGFFFAFAISSASSSAIWQCKVAPDVQGRVFATRSAIATSAMPLAYLLAGPLADGVFEPLLAVDGPLAASAGRVIGTGPGRGIGLMFVAAGILTTLVSLGAYLHPRIRLVEKELPDVVTTTESATASPAGGDPQETCP